MVMQVAPQIEAKIEQLVASGQYADAGDVVEKAVLLLEEREQKLNRLRAALAIGEAQERAGQLIELTSERFEAIQRVGLENARLRKPIKDAVKP